MTDDDREGAEVEARIAAGRIKHGVGSSENFPGNVCHLVSPIVGTLRLRESQGVALRPDEIAHFIDRLALVLDMARQEAERDESAGWVLTSPALGVSDAG